PDRIDGPLRGRITRAAGGNPLYLEGLLAMTADSGGDVAVPPSLQALLAARLDQLDPSELALLQLGSVEGASFAWAAVEQRGGGGPQVAQHLGSLVRRGLVRAERMPSTGEDGFRFCHQLIRDAAYARLPKAVRADVHERLAAWLEAHGSRLVVLD